MNSSLHHIGHTRTLHIDFESHAGKSFDFNSKLVSTIIDTIEDLRQTLQKTLQTRDTKHFLRASQGAVGILKILNDSGMLGAVIKLRAHFRGEINLDDVSFRRNIARLDAIGTMLVEALKGKGMAA